MKFIINHFLGLESTSEEKAANLLHNFVPFPNEKSTNKTKRWRLLDKNKYLVASTLIESKWGIHIKQPDFDMVVRL